MKISYIVVFVSILCVGCAHLRVSNKPVSTQGIAMRALEIEKGISKINKARLLVNDITLSARRQFATNSVELQSLEALQLIHRVIQSYGYKTYGKSGVHTTFGSSMVHKQLDCSDYVLLYLEIAKACGISMNMVFGRNHVMVTIPTIDGDILWETTSGKERNIDEYISLASIDGLSITNKAYMVSYPEDVMLGVVYYEAAIQLKRIGRKHQAEKFMRLAIEHHPCFVNAWSAMGAIHAKHKRYDEARQAFEKAISLDPLFEPAHQNLKMLILITEDYDQFGKIHE